MNYCVMCKLFYLYCKVESSSFIVIRMVFIGVIMGSTAVVLKMYYYLRRLHNTSAHAQISPYRGMGQLQNCSSWGGVGGGSQLLRMRRSPRTMKWANRKAARDEEGGTVKLTRGVVNDYGRPPIQCNNKDVETCFGHKLDKDCDLPKERTEFLLFSDVFE